jgi:hypothetical protein
MNLTYLYVFLLLSYINITFVPNKVRGENFWIRGIFFGIVIGKGMKMKRDTPFHFEYEYGGVEGMSLNKVSLNRYLLINKLPHYLEQLY